MDLDDLDQVPLVSMKTCGQEYVIMFADAIIFSAPNSEASLINLASLNTFLRNQITRLCRVLATVNLRQDESQLPLPMDAG